MEYVAFAPLSGRYRYLRVHRPARREASTRLLVAWAVAGVCVGDGAVLHDSPAVARMSVGVRGVEVKWGVVMRTRTGGCGSVDVLSFRPHDADRPTGEELPRPTSTHYYQIQSLLVRNTSKTARAMRK